MPCRADAFYSGGIDNVGIEGLVIICAFFIAGREGKKRNDQQDERNISFHFTKSPQSWCVFVWDREGLYVA